jgi:hypothetical protein
MKIERRKHEQKRLEFSRAEVLEALSKASDLELLNVKLTVTLEVCK